MIERRPAVCEIGVVGPDFRKLFESVPGACLVLDTDLTISAASDACVRELGKDRDALVGRRLFDVFPDDPEVRSSIQRVIMQRMADAIVVDTPDQRTWSKVSSPVIGDDGEVTQVIHRIEEVTAAMRADEQLRELVDHMDVAALRIDPSGVIQRANRAAARLVGYDQPEAMIGVDARTMAVDDDPTRAPEVQAELRRTGMWSGQRQIRRLDGQTVTAQAAYRLVSDRRGRWAGVDAILRDVTDELRLHEQIVRAREAAEAANRAKTAFLANISHEIRTPMNAIIGLAHLALGAQPPPRIREYLVRLKASAKTLLDLLNDVLDVSKIEAGRLTLESTAFDLDQVLESAAHVIALRAAEKELEVAFSVAPEVPPRLVGDPLRLGQVLTNFLTNAVKFTDEGAVIVSVSALEVAAERCRLRFEVRDTGIGMDEGQVARLFRPFSQADASTTRKYGGTGLGLTISKQLVEQMGGAIEVASAPGQGTSFAFTIELPLAPDDPHRQLWLDADLRGLRVLVVDDSQVALDVLSSSLDGLGLAPTCVVSGADAIEAVRAADRRGEPFRVVLVDARMPEMDGFETAERIGREPGLAEPPALLMMSAYSRDELGDAREVLPASAFLRKPISRSTLLDAIVGAIRRVPATGAAALVAAGPRPLDGVRLLVVEDNEINQLIAREILERAGALVAVASSGHEAIDLATVAQPPYDAILMDVQMPELDGHATTRLLRRSPRTRSVPILAMTAQAFEEERQACIASGMNDHIAKPVDPDHLIETIVRWAAPARPPIDRALLTRIFGDDPVRQGAFLRRLVSSMERSMDEIADAAARRAGAELAALGHKLKSPARSVGANELAEAFEGLESAARAEAWSAVELHREWALRHLAAVNRYVERADPDA